MPDSNVLSDIAKRLIESLPPGVREFEKDLQNKFHSILQTAFSQLDLVTREEFDVQRKVLERTRTKLDDLEQQLAILESKYLAIQQHSQE